MAFTLENKTTINEVIYLLEKNKMNRCGNPNKHLKDGNDYGTTVSFNRS